MKHDPETFAEMVVTTIKRAIDGPRCGGRIAELEQRIKDLEAELRSKSLPKYCGPHQPGAPYSVGNLVTRQGGLWLCADDTSSTPGTDGAWRLIVRRGQA